MNTRTERTFPVNGDLWPFVEQWAKANGYWARGSTGPERLYQKGQGFLVAPMMVNLRQENGQVTLQSWVRINLFNRICSAFILPAEIGVESGGLKAILPRKMARDSVNHLLQQIGQPPIG